MDKKNQHYVPKFYLRNFSFNLNKKQIGLYNLKSKHFFQTAKLKAQASKNNFYGADGIIETYLQEIENVVSRTINKIISTKKLFSKISEDYYNLLVFIAITLLRNPTTIENITNQSTALNKTLEKVEPSIKLNDRPPQISKEESIKIAMSMISHIVPMIIDLDCKLLKNNTSIPFITSDFPAVKYNQFLEERKWPLARTGFGHIGLQIFIPLSPELTVMLFDNNIYKVGFRNSQVHELSNVNDINQLNLLQVLNCSESVFFNEKVFENYIRNLLEESRRFNRPNQVTSELLFTFSKNGTSVKKSKNKDLIITGTTECEIKLKLTGIIKHSKAKCLKMGNNAAEGIRPAVREKMRY